MTVFVYKAVDNQGRLIQDHREAPDEQHLIQTLQKEGLMPVKVSSASNSFFYLLRFGKAQLGLTHKQVGMFTRELSTLLLAGLPLDKSLNVLGDLFQEHEKLHQLIDDVLEKVKGGSTLADALEAQTNSFSRFFINMVRAGELGGNLEEVLGRLSEYLENANELRDTVKTALIYPSILFIMSIASLFVMMIFVVPQFSEMFASAGKELPLLTQIVMGVAEFLQNYWWVLVAIVTLCAAYLNYLLIEPSRKKVLDKRLLDMPLIGEVIINMETSNMSRSMGTLLGNGVSIITALNIVQETIVNLQLAETVSIASEKLKQGGNMSEALVESGRFPKLALQMIKMGEETGRLEEMLLKVANIYDKQLRVAIQRMLALLEPVLIISLGLMIGVIIASILMAILSVNDLAF